MSLPLKPRALDFTITGLEADLIAPLVAGDDWALRLQVRTAADVADGLASAKIVMTLRELEHGDDASNPTVLVRRWDTNIAGSSPATLEIEIDANQTTEVGDTGKGWFTIRFGHSEEATIAALGPKVRYFDIRIRRADDTVFTWGKGKIQFQRPRVSPMP